MKNQILALLIAKFVGVNEQVLGRIADKLTANTTANSTQEELTTLVEGVTFQQVIDSHADARATQATQTAVANYEAKYGLKEGQKVTVEGSQNQNVLETQGGNNETPAWAKAIIDSNKALQDKISAMEGEKVTTSRKQTLEAITSKLPENLRKSYARTSVENLSDDEFEALKTEISTEVDAVATELNAKGAVFGRPAAQSGGNNPKDALSKEQEDAISARGGVPKDGQQPF